MTRDPDPSPPAPSPAAERLAEEHGLDTEQLRGTGKDGRLLQRDVMAALENLARDEDEGSERRRSSPERWPEAPPLAAQLAVEEVDLGRLTQLIERWGPSFRARHGLELGLRSFLVKAIVEALATVPDANVQLHQGSPQRNEYYDVALATPGPGVPRAPVLRSPQRKGFGEIEGELARFERQVRDGSLPAEAETGAVITLHWREGLLLSSVSIEPPQTLALAVHRVQPRPVVRAGAVVIRPVTQLALGWDPRALDGATAAALLGRIAELLAQPERLWLGL
jgi:2-oxoglutarate dehydrogenase E2 component (dihydrolipoamide succinyltransferase)